MERKKLANLFLVVLALVVVAIFAFAVRLEAAADAVVVLKANGMTCGSCAGRIEKALKERPGVASVEVDVEAGQVVVGYDSKLAEPGKLASGVTGIGFGCSVLQVMTAEEYRAATGKEMGGRPVKGGCGCCYNKQVSR